MQTNKSIIVVITTTLAILAFCCVSTICVMSYYAIEIPPELNTLTAALVGALTAMLTKTAPSETTKSPVIPPNGLTPAPVEVVNTPAEPVQTEEVK